VTFIDEPQRQASLTTGTINYRDTGIAGPPILFVHGLLVNGTLWRHVAEDLSTDFRCIVPDWPLGSHAIPMNKGADLSPTGVSDLIAQFLDELDLRDVVIVANDTGGAVAQLLTVRHPERLGGLVLTSCDAFENFLPPMFRPLQYAARIPGGVNLAVQSLRWKTLRRAPFAYGWLSKRRLPDSITQGWLKPAQTQRAIRHEAASLLRAINPSDTMQAASQLQNFEAPVLLAWARDDRFFPLDHARRLAALLPNASLQLIEDSYTFVPEDQPHALSAAIRAFMNQRPSSRV
jgi:pimeloyl-ACP methyl ester carboxylesterase